MQRTAKYYTFNQNNSGGIFYDRPKSGISATVIIEARSAKEANRLAEDIGIYFDGCDNGIDCECCGNRWYRVSDDDGYDVPSIYGTPVEPGTNRWGSNVYLHKLDGTFEVI